MKYTVVLVLLVVCSLYGVAQTPTKAQEQVRREQERIKLERERAKAEMERSKAEIERARAEIERVRLEMNRNHSATVLHNDNKKEVERKRKIQEAMRRGVVVVPMRTYPDDYINPGSNTDRTLPEELQEKRWWERLDCYTLKPDQITVSPRSVDSYSVYEIEDAGNETRITFALPISYDRQWHALSKGQVMIDNATGNRYFPRRIEKNIPFDKVLVINGSKGHTLLFTVVYPRLSTGAVKVTFTDAWPIKTELPLNRAPRRDMVVEDVRSLARKKGRDIY